MARAGRDDFLTAWCFSDNSGVFSGASEVFPFHDDPGRQFLRQLAFVADEFLLGHGEVACCV